MEYLKIATVIGLYLAVLGFGILCLRLMGRRERFRTWMLESRRGKGATSRQEDSHG